MPMQQGRGWQRQSSWWQSLGVLAFEEVLKLVVGSSQIQDFPSTWVVNYHPTVRSARYGCSSLKGYM